MMEQCKLKHEEELPVDQKFSFASITYTKITPINLILLCTSV
jgi:hypothetical protein